MPKANLLGCSVDWFSFCRSNSILRNVRLASSALFLLQLRQRPVPKRGDEKAQGREIFFAGFLCIVITKTSQKFSKAV